MDDRQRQTLQQNTIVLNVVYAESQCFPKVLRDNNVIWDLNTILCRSNVKGRNFTPFLAANICWWKREFSSKTRWDGVNLETRP